MLGFVTIIFIIILFYVAEADDACENCKKTCRKPLILTIISIKTSNDIIPN